MYRKGPTDQITNLEKKQIRSRARRFTLDLLDAPFGEALQIYQETIDDLYDGKARIRICLKCADINSTEKLSKKTHSCTSGFDKLAFPYLITTSWLKLRYFFLTEVYTEFLQRLGVEPIPSRKIPVRTPIEEEEKAEEEEEVRETSG